MFRKNINVSCLFKHIPVLQSCVVKEVPAHNGRYDMGCNPDQVTLISSSIF